MLKLILMNHTSCNSRQVHIESKQAKNPTSHFGTPHSKFGTTTSNISSGGNRNVPTDTDNTHFRLYGGTGIGGTGAVYLNLQNDEYIGSNKVEWIYKDAKGALYGTYDNSKDLVKFTASGLSICLFIFSIYLFHVATNLYEEYFNRRSNEKYFSVFFYVCIGVFNIAWVFIVLRLKGISSEFIFEELLHYPNQFLLGIMLSNLLLFGIGTFRFAIIAIIPTASGNEKKLKDRRFSIIGVIFGLLSILGSIASIWSLLKQ